MNKNSKLHIVRVVITRFDNLILSFYTSESYMSRPEEDLCGVYNPDQILSPAQPPSETKDDGLLQRIRGDAHPSVIPITPEETASVKHLCKTEQQYNFLIALASDHPMPPQEISEKVWEDSVCLTRFNAALATTRVVLADTPLEVKNASLKGSPAQYYLGRKADETVINATIVSPEGEILYIKAYIALKAGYNYADSYEFRRDFKKIPPEIGVKGERFEGSGRRNGYNVETTYRIILALAAIKDRAASPEKVDIVKNTKEVVSRKKEENFKRKFSSEDGEFFGMDLHPSGLTTPDHKLTPEAYRDFAQRLARTIYILAGKSELSKLHTDPERVAFAQISKHRDVKEAFQCYAQQHGGLGNFLAAVISETYEEQGKNPEVINYIVRIVKNRFAQGPTETTNRNSSNSTRYPDPPHSSELNLDSLPGLVNSLRNPI